MESKRQVTVEPSPVQGEAYSPLPRDGAGHNGHRPHVMDAERFHDASERILGSINKVIDGKADAAKLALTVLLAQGHLLLEDVPGVGKTLLAKTLARSVDCTVSRIQYTPD